MKFVLKNTILFFIISALFLTLVACGSNTDTDEPNLNVSNIVLPLDESKDSSLVSTEDSSSDVSSESESSNDSSESSYETSSQVTSSQESSSALPPATYEGDWKLILVNSDNLLPENYTIKTADIGNRTMDERIVDIVNRMIADAKNDGVDLLICSSYRSVDRQTTLFNEEINQFMNLGYSYDDAKIEAAKWVAIPRTSEHHTGLALDIVTPTYQVLDFGYEETDAFKWLYSHCTEYGFILRYPKDKTDITGIVYEPWHYRYVGVDAAKYIHANGLCLEEYIEQLNG